MRMTRRQFLAGSAAGLTAFVLGSSRGSRADAAPTDALFSLDATAQADLVRAGEATPLELLDAAIARVEALNPKLNAVVTKAYDPARERAKTNKPSGRFGGVPMLIKDLNDVAGIRTTNGCRALMDVVPDESDAWVKACEAAGFNIFGKTNTPEFGLEATTESLALGPCHNPWDRHRSSGGSSGGAGAAVASGMLPLAHGNDGGGSIRIPASCCGVFGLKTSRGRLVGEGDEFSLAVEGGLSRTVRDTANLLAATERETPAPGLTPVGVVDGPSKRRLKIGMYLKGLRGEQPAEDVAAAIRSTAALCRDLGHEVREFAFTFDGVQFVDDFLTLWASSAAMDYMRVEQRLRRTPTVQDLEPLTLSFTGQFANGGRERMPLAMEGMQKVAAKVTMDMAELDVLLCPVLRTAPPMIAEQSPTVPFDVLIERMKSYVAYTPLFNATGMPAMSVPLYRNPEGLPIGSQFAAPYGGERTLLELAFELEAARPWADAWAPVSAKHL